MTDCIFCKIAQKEVPSKILYEDQEIIVFNDIHPKARVHLLIVPKAHIQSLATTKESDALLLSKMLLLLPKLAQEHNLDTGFRTVINTGAGGGQEINHLHFHLLGGGSLPKM